MEQTFKQTVQNRQANKPTRVELRVLCNSNAIHAYRSSFAELSSDAMRLLGIKKALD